MNEASWAEAPAFDGFVQSFPQAGERPGERTEVRILHDAQTLYVGIRCLDSQPAEVQRTLGRRDALPPSDVVTVMIDSAHDHRSAYLFSVNAGGVLHDALLFEDVEQSDDWDAVWDAQVSHDEGGWSAELAIPFAAIRYSAASTTWGFHVRRQHARTREQLDSVVIPRSARALVSRFGHLEGLALPPGTGRVQLQPYLATRGILRPRYPDPSLPEPRLFDPSLDLGLDLHWAITPDLSLSGALNPDFGQVEADEIILNFSTFEQFFPEKRPFFTQGMELFAPLGAESTESPHQLFYSRRIGLEAPILASAKVLGAVGGNTQVGLLSALVMGAADPLKAAALARGEDPELLPPTARLRFHLTRPLHLGLDRELPAVAPTAQHHLAGVVRTQLGESSRVTLRGTSVLPLGDACVVEGEEVSDADCTPVGGNAAAVEWDWTTEDRVWGALAQATLSQSLGGPSGGRLLVDGTRLAPGALGTGVFARGGKLGGEPFRAELGYHLSSPTLELNPAGYLRTQNEHKASAQLMWLRTSMRGPLLQEVRVWFDGDRTWTADGRNIVRGDRARLNVSGVTNGFHTFSCETGMEWNRHDVREVAYTGTPYLRSPFAFVGCVGQTDPNRLLSLSLDAYVDHAFATGATRSRPGGGGSLGLIVRPQPWLQTELSVMHDGFLDSPWHVETLPSGEHVFAELTPSFASVTLRQLMVLAPRLTLQAYAQLFGGTARYGPYYLAPEGAPIRSDTLVPFGAEDTHSFQAASLNLNVVLRWEYRPGSVIFLVYSRGQERLPPLPGRALQEAYVTRDLLAGPTVDTAMLKWTSFWQL